MSYKISKELFEAVMNIEPRGNTFRVESKGMYYAKNYYTHNDFFFMCKEWATKKCIWISSWASNDTNNKKGLCEVGHCVKGKIGIFESHTEQQAVFDACTYILNELSNK